MFFFVCLFRCAIITAFNYRPFLSLETETLYQLEVTPYFSLAPLSCQATSLLSVSLGLPLSYEWTHALRSLL